MQLRSIESREIELVAEWLGKKENYQWLDFGNGHQILSPVSLKVMTQRDSYLTRIFTCDSEDLPIGVVALSHISPAFKSATLWYVLGDKRFGGQGYTTRAVSRILALAFKDLGLHAVNAWTVESNEPSIKVLTHNGFRMIGRQRSCHYIDGQRFDRLLFDLLEAEHPDIHHEACRQFTKEIQRVFESKLNIEVPSTTTDLIGSGLLDSLLLVELLLQLEQEFGVTISPDRLELEDFRTVDSIAHLVASLKTALAAPSTQSGLDSLSGEAGFYSNDRSESTSDHVHRG